MSSFIQRLIHQIFFKSSWVIAFFIASSIIFERSLKEKTGVYRELTTQLTSLHKAKERAMIEQQDLLSQINSQNDPDWIELTLIRVLGLVPEGQQKIYFYPETLNTTQNSSENV